MGSASRESAAAVSALGAYLTTVLPRVRRELRRLGPLPREKTMNAEAVSVFASLSPRSTRATVVRAIVALQVGIDLRDAVEESAAKSDSGATARLASLDTVWRREVATLPAGEAVLPRLEQALERCAQGQLHTHRAAQEGEEPLQRWASGLQAPPDYRWWEVAAGASSSVAAHALVAAAADPATRAESAALIDAAYHPPVGALTVLLDDLVDRERDRAAGEHNYLAYYGSPEEAAERLALIAGRAETLLARLPDPHRHRAILAGVAAYYLSAATAETRYAQPIRERLLDALGSGVRPLAGFMRVRRLGERKRPGQAGNPPRP